MKEKEYIQIVNETKEYLQIASNNLPFTDDPINDIQEQLDEIDKYGKKLNSKNIDNEIISRVNISINLKIIYAKLEDTLKAYSDNIKERKNNLNKINKYISNLKNILNELDSNSLQYIELNDIYISLQIQNNYLEKSIILEQQTKKKFNLIKEKIFINLKLLDSLKKLKHMSYRRNKDK